jgi:hypothetical protein
MMRMDMNWVGLTSSKGPVLSTVLQVKNGQRQQYRVGDGRGISHLFSKHSVPGTEFSIRDPKQKMQSSLVMTGRQVLTISQEKCLKT